MNMEEALTVIQKIKDAWAAFGQSMAGAAQALEDMFRSLAKNYRRLRTTLIRSLIFGGENGIAG